MSFASMTHTMATAVEVFDGLRQLSIVEHQEGDPLQFTTGSNEVYLRAGECYLLPPNRPYEAACNSIGVVVTTLSLAELQSHAAGLGDETVDFDFTRALTPASGRYWSQAMQYVDHLVKYSPLLESAPLARRELGWLVNSAVLACFPNATLDAEGPSYAGDTPQPLRRALAFMDERAGDPITLNEIATAARLSPRGLQAAFRRHLDITPLAYLRSVRMEQAHRDLEDAAPGDGVSVAAVAARWGFTHLGRFAVEYRRRFGIYPSQTLRS
jgi:AraC-like DNA-binding protein